MTTTDDIALREQIARAIKTGINAYPIEEWDPRDEWEVAADEVLPIIHAKVAKARAEALRDAAGDIVWSAETLPHMTPHDAARGLVRRADQIEKEQNDGR